MNSKNVHVAQEPASTTGSLTLSKLLDDSNNAMMLLDKILGSNVSNETENKQQLLPDQHYSENVPKWICLEQEYHDHMNDPCADIEQLRGKRGTNRPFPTILYTVMQDMEKLGTEHIAVLARQPDEYLLFSISSMQQIYCCPIGHKEIIIFAQDRVAMLTGERPDCLIINSFQVNITNMDATWKASR